MQNVYMAQLEACQNEISDFLGREQALRDLERLANIKCAGVRLYARKLSNSQVSGEGCYSAEKLMIKQMEAQAYIERASKVRELMKLCVSELQTRIKIIFIRQQLHSGNAVDGEALTANLRSGNIRLDIIAQNIDRVSRTIRVANSRYKSPISGA